MLFRLAALKSISPLLSPTHRSQASAEHVVVTICKQGTTALELTIKLLLDIFGGTDDQGDGGTVSIETPRFPTGGTVLYSPKVNPFACLVSSTDRVYINCLPCAWNLPVGSVLIFGSDGSAGEQKIRHTERL